MSRRHHSDEPGLTELLSYYLAKRRGNRTLRRARRCASEHRSDTPAAPALALPEVVYTAGRHRCHG